jgi:hypothetical protein
MLFPRLGDWAMLRLPDGANMLNAAVAEAGLFDEYWRFATK